jgi:hypothetical protein
MAICLAFEGAGISQAQYDQVRNEVAPSNQPPQGMLYHVAGPATNGFTVIEVWESQEDANRFFQETLGPALQRASINVQPNAFAVHNIIQR